MSKSQRKLFSVMTILLSLLLLAGCATAQKVAETGAVRLEYAKGFKIENVAGGCQEVTDGEGRTLLLVPRGQQAPSAYKNLPTIYTPVKRVVAVSTTEAAFLRPLGELGSIIGVTVDKKHWYINPVKEGMASGKIQMVGGGAGMGPLAYGKIVALKPDLVFMSTGTSGDVQTLKKLEELKIPVAVDNSWLESDPLGRLEWIKFIAAFYGKGQQADQFFAQAVQKVSAIKEKVAGDKDKPKVLWGMIYQGKAYVPGGDSYAAKMIALAGGDYLFKNLKGTGSVPITLEEYYAKGKEANVYISDTMPDYGVTSIADISKQSPVLAGFPTLRQGKVWCYQPWYFQSLDKTAEVIGDLAEIFHPHLFPGRQLKEFMKLPQS
ncbi:ABC transporter periplasmic binding domain protein [Acididesulfobacillus acetoxydans]|uniref:ABC transporter periplasmic binding domain protein n=1 Tax=Acididesulfobacillus acetoxydans TaxID=1561005 RepID=A0A8S0WIB7_9FIRM|nr:ABC transporter substrate-binding protein [Acididesulfobacillus acetoxydans]CAA7603232.1 ABC transporter periplasmic binding domain protein [Acididesulfobacillus acetoxydans]